MTFFFWLVLIGMAYKWSQIRKKNEEVAKEEKEKAERLIRDNESLSTLHDDLVRRTDNQRAALNVLQESIARLEGTLESSGNQILAKANELNRIEKQIQERQYTFSQQV